MRTALGLSVLFAMAANGSGQSRKAIPAKPVVITGRIFAITVDGDLKPARLATVHLFYISTEEDSAWAHYRSELGAVPKRNETGAYYIHAGAEHDGDTQEHVDSMICRMELQNEIDAIERTVAWARQTGKSEQVLSSTADEEGQFKIVLPQPRQNQVFEIFAHGQAGLNLALWEAPTPLGPDIIKLSSPSKACLQWLGPRN